MPEPSHIFDTVSLSNFFLSDSVEIVRGLYRRRAAITWEAYGELSAGVAEYPPLKLVDMLIDDKTITVVTMSRAEHDSYQDLIRNLGKGEASSIAVARHRRWCVVTDDKAARRACASLKVAVTGTIGILKSAVVKKILTVEQADAVLTVMIGNGYYSPVRRISDVM